MAATVVDDFTTIWNADSLPGGEIGIGNINSPAAADTTVFVEGTASARARVNGAGIGGTGFDSGAANKDVVNRHIMIWARSLNAVNANDGWRIRVATDVAATANFGEYSVGDADSVRTTVKGFYNFCVDSHKPFFATTGTPPALTAIRTFAMIANHGAASSRETWFQDEIKHGTGITVTGGTGGDPGTSDNIAAVSTEDRGTFKDISGGFYILGRVTIGDVTAATNSTFLDKNKVWIFEGQEVSATFHRIVCVGGTGTNIVTFGASSGSGNAKEGSGGNTFVAGGLIPFRFEAIDSEITVELFGCSFTGPVTLRDDALRSFKVEDSSGGPSFTTDTRDANDAGANDAAPFPAGAGVNDATYFGHNERFSKIKINTGTAGVGAYTVTWEYSTAAGWTALTDVTDGSSGFKTTGLQTLDFAIPDDWVAKAVDGATHYWIRARRDAGTVTTNPNLTQCFTVMGGGVRLEHTNAEAIRTTFTNMDTIRIRNSAKLKKCIISDSVAPAKSAALDLGSTDPATDTVRDLTIQNCSKGILLKKAAAGDVTYNFRNITFANNTNDVRVDFPSGSTVTINIVDGGTPSPTIDNVNGSTIVISNPVTVLVNAKDNTGANLQNARVFLEASDGTGDFPFKESVTITRVTTTASVVHTGHGMETGDVAVIRDADQQEYNGAHTITNVTVNGYDYTVSGSPATPATGTITSTGAILNGLTDASGNISAIRTFGLATPVSGVVRKSTASPRFKSFDIAGTISTSEGLTRNVRMILNE